MKTQAFIVFCTSFLQICVAQQVFWNDNIIYPEGMFFDNNYGLNTYISPLNGAMYTVDRTTGPLVFAHNSPVSQMNTAEMYPSASTNAVSIDDNIQPIFKLLDHSRFSNVNKNSKFDLTSPSNNVQHIPEIVLPNYNHYSTLYEPQYPQFGLNNGVMEVPDQGLFLAPDMSFIKPNSYSDQLNMYLNKNPFTPRTEVASPNDEVYKFKFKPALPINTQDQPNNKVNAVRGFKTNFTGDISKCDMICKCRNVLAKQPASSEPKSKYYSSK